MAHECDECGVSFETLTRLRLHDCGDVQTDRFCPSSTADTSTSTGSSVTDERNASVAELDTLLDRVADGDADAIHDAVGAFESALSAALEEDNAGKTYRDVFWPYYERVSNSLDDAVRADGWTLLREVIDAYDPAVDGRLPLVTPAIANAVGRYLIRTRLTDDVEAIPVAALEYLDTVAVSATDSDDVAREEVHAYGWGIGHPSHPVLDRLHARASTDIFTVNPSLEHAFYADQYAAVDALEQVVRDESIDGALPRINREDMPHRRYVLDCVYSLNIDDYWPNTPRYADWHDECAYTFELDPAVEQRIRELVEAMGFDADLPDDWTFRDLAV